MTIKHSIPRTAEVTHPDGQLWGDIEWAIELFYNSVKTESLLVWKPDPLVTRYGRESQHSAESWALGPPIEHPGERERHNADGHKSGGQYIAVLFGLQLPLTQKTFQIKWEVYIFFKEFFARLHYWINMYSACICVCIYAYEYTT